MTNPAIPAITPIMILLLPELRPEFDVCETAFSAAVTSAIEEPVTVPILTIVREMTKGIALVPDETYVVTTETSSNVDVPVVEAEDTGATSPVGLDEDPVIVCSDEKVAVLCEELVELAKALNELDDDELELDDDDVCVDKEVNSEITDSLASWSEVEDLTTRELKPEVELSEVSADVTSADTPTGSGKKFDDEGLVLLVEFSRDGEPICSARVQCARITKAVHTRQQDLVRSIL